MVYSATSGFTAWSKLPDVALMWIHLTAKREGKFRIRPNAFRFSDVLPASPATGAGKQLAGEQ
jgi:hypothetical protein